MSSSLLSGALAGRESTSEKAPSAVMLLRPTLASLTRMVLVAPVGVIATRNPISAWRDIGAAWLRHAERHHAPSPVQHPPRNTRLAMLATASGSLPPGKRSP